MSHVRLIFAVLFLAAIPTAFADSIQYTLNSTAVLNISSPNDNYYGAYVNIPSQPQISTSSEAWGLAMVSIPDVSVIVPTGATITSAFLTLFVASDNYQGTGYQFPVGGFDRELDPGIPSVAPTYSTIGTSEINVDELNVTGLAMTNGDEAYSQFESLNFYYVGEITSAIVDPGSNWAGYVGGNGQVDIPYTVQLDVTYTPVPEPSTFTLLGIGMFGLAGAVRRKSFFHSRG